ncbi:hypothetical protein QQX98_007683 [Neonectria punicea]|uniref:Uncharacterized protein n=1 Tax=Neonectria punicea TaxID=979145 RepID=A0ABR1GXB2_9HYPO
MSLPALTNQASFPNVCGLKEGGMVLVAAPRSTISNGNGMSRTDNPSRSATWLDYTALEIGSVVESSWL